jgi:hypothetical protein
MKKRGEATLWFLIELVATVFLVYMAIDVSTTIVEGTFFEKLNIARDISMQINTLSGLHGDGYIINNNLHGYSLHFFKDKVEVYEQLGEDTKGIHSFVAISDTDYSLNYGKPDQIVISKIDGQIEISEDIPNIR